MKPIQEFAIFLERKRKNDLLLYLTSVFQSLDKKLVEFIKQQKWETSSFNNDLLKHTLDALKDPNPTGVLQNYLAKGALRNQGVQLKAHDVDSIAQILKAALASQIPFYSDNPHTIFLVHKTLDDLYFQFLNREKNEGFPLPSRDSEAENEVKYKDFFDHAHDLMHLVKPDGTVIYVNDAWQQTLGYPLEEIEGQSIFSFVDDDDVPRYEEYRRSIIKGFDRNKITIRLKAKNSNRIVVEGSISVKERGGQPIYTRGVFRDITSRIEKEEELKSLYTQLRERQENLLRMVTYAPDAIIVINAESIISYWNPKAEIIFGWKAKEVEGRQLSEIIIPPIYREAHHKGMKRFLATREAMVLNKTIDVTAINKRGEELNISLTISNATEEGNDVFISFIRDTTQEKKNELELARKRKELEESNKELEQYSWLTSHDLREPLRKILTFSDILITRQKEEISPAVERNIEKIYQAAQRMNNLIQAVLSYSEATQKQELFEKTDLNKIIKDVLADLELTIDDNQARVETDELPVIDAIPFQMRQLFQNLIGNAIKYRRHDVIPYIHISSQEQDGRVHISIKDNGHGFSTPNKEKIFQLFQRLQSPGKTEGMGIGLAICKKITEQHDGFIKVDSTPNVGTTFIISLPVEQKFVG